MKKIIAVIIFIFAVVSDTFSQPQQLIQARVEVDYLIRDSVDNVGNLYIKAWCEHPSVLTFVNADGSVTVCTSDEKNTYIYEYDINLQEQKTLTFQNELFSLGAFTKDNECNYYFFYAKNAANQNTENMVMVKYDKEGEKTNSYKQKADPVNSFGGIYTPYYAGTCRLELSGSMLAVYFSRQLFDRHQASYGFVLDKDTFERIDKGHAYYYTDGTYPKGNNLLPFTGHSMNQFIIPIDNGFVFTDHGDAYPRAFTFGKFQNGSGTKRLNAFRFPGGTGANATYAELGGLAKTSNGYIFTGTYGMNINNSRNLFVLTFDEEMNSCSAPIYLTKYTKNDGHAGHPKIVQVDTDRYLLLWEVFRFSTQSANTIESCKTEYLSTYMLLIDEKGKAISEPHAEPRELKGIHLNINDTLRYNPHNGKVYWAINDSNKSITVYALDKI